MFRFIVFLLLSLGFNSFVFAESKAPPKEVINYVHMVQTMIKAHWKPPRAGKIRI